MDWVWEGSTSAWALSRKSHVFVDSLGHLLLQVFHDFQSLLQQMQLKTSMKLGQSVLEILLAVCPLNRPLQVDQIAGDPGRQKANMVPFHAFVSMYR